MASIEFRNLNKNYGNVTALKDVNLTIKAGEFITVLGPSGSGKTTLLNLVSGMTFPSSGEILIDGVDVTGFTPQKRNLGMVFQNYALMPHMSVFQNIAFPLRIRKLPKLEIDERVERVLDTVQLNGFAHRKPKELSGGQQQRVSIARCLVYEPKLILMDEPLGALDKKLREQLQLEIKKIHRASGVTIMYVTHDQEEAMVLSDRISIMNDSQIVQTGTPDELYLRPNSVFVASFLGESNIFECTVERGQDGAPRISTLIGPSDGTAIPADLGIGSTAKLLVRPDAISLVRPDTLPGATNLIFQDSMFVGDATRIYLRAGDQQVTVKLPGRPALDQWIDNGRVSVTWSAKDATVLPSSAAKA